MFKTLGAPGIGTSIFSRILNYKAILSAAALALSGIGATTFAAEDKYAVRVPGGLAFSEFRGYENWQVVAVSQTDNVLKVIVANPIMIDAYRSGTPGNGKPFPEGAKIAKIIWNPKKNPEAPFAVSVPDTLKEVEFIEKDSKRFAKTSGWAYAPYLYSAASGAYTPIGSGAECGYSCHTLVAKKDYIFTAYAKR